MLCDREAFAVSDNFVETNTDLEADKCEQTVDDLAVEATVKRTQRADVVVVSKFSEER